MKFESKFGIGEIVLSKLTRRDGKICGDHMGEVIGVSFSPQGVTYSVRMSSHAHVVGFDEGELIGDDLFDQETGYPEEAKND